MHQRLVGLVEPMGAEHRIAAGIRARLGDPDEMLFTGTHAEAGLINYTTPVETQTGAWLTVSPLAFLVLRAEITGLDLWPIGMNGAGHYPVDGYDADVSSENLPAEAGEHASGWRVAVAGTLQGAIPLHPAFRILLFDELGGEHVALGDARHYYSPRYDLVLGRNEWMLANSALVLGEATFDDSALLRFGAYDDLRSVPRSGQLSNQVGGLVALTLGRVDPAVPELSFFIRAGVFTHHRSRAGLPTGLAGVQARYSIR